MKAQWKDFEFISVASIIFLRNICPAVVSPAQLVSASHRKGLIGIAKILQNFALNQPFPEKPGSVLAINDFIMTNHKRVENCLALLTVIHREARSYLTRLMSLGNKSKCSNYKGTNSTQQ